MLAKYILVVAAAVVGTALAQEKCDAQPQFDLCKKNMQTNVDACGPTDYKCLCKAHKIILNNCYPLCPDDTGKGSQESVVTSWCVSAGGEETSSSVSVPAPTTTSSTNTETSTDTPPTETGTDEEPTDDADNSDSDPSGTTDAPEPQDTSAANTLISGAAGVVAAAAAAVMGLVL